jgi:hypothetical protein
MPDRWNVNTERGRGQPCPSQEITELGKLLLQF